MFFKKHHRHFLFFSLCACLFLAANGAQARGRHKVVGQGGRLLAYGLRFNPADESDHAPELLQEMLRQYRTGRRHASRLTGGRVEPLLRSVRDQDAPYNWSCPYYRYSDGTLSEERCLSGCVATSLEQVLSYWRYPEALRDTLYGWSTDRYTIPDVLPGATIDWANIIPDYRGGYTEAQGRAIADLTYWLGVAVRMNWGLSSSGANMYRAEEPLQRVFGYQTAQFVQRCFYRNETWNRLLRNELENGRPICYVGHNMAMSGHAFNIDGVDEQGYYHLNWGYNGEYDGWFDLDFLNPFEPANDATELGRYEGLFSNQGALLLCPTAVETLQADSLTEAEALTRVVVENVAFRREPDTEGFVIADVTMHNTGDDDLCLTFEVLTNSSADTAIFQQADYVTVSAVNLTPHERKTFPIYCQFSETGERLFGISADDSTFLYRSPVTIKKGTTSRLKWGDISVKQYISAEDGLMADFFIPVTNEAAGGMSGQLVTFCLRPDGGSEDIRHWEVLQLPAGEEQTLRVRYKHLTDGHPYTLSIRCPWTVRTQFSFTAKASEAGDGIEDIIIKQEMNNQYHDLSGRRLLHPRRGLNIINGKKIWLTTEP